MFFFATETAATPPCPFHDAFHFIYNNSSGGACRNPMSYVKPCADSSFLTFHFKKCPDAAYTFDRGQHISSLNIYYPLTCEDVVLSIVLQRSIASRIHFETGNSSQGWKLYATLYGSTTRESLVRMGEMGEILNHRVARLCWKCVEWI